MTASMCGMAASKLQKLYVRPPWRRRGLGEHLRRLAKQDALQRRCGFVELWSDIKLLSAHRLYERLGYVRHGH
jgi:putative acetyltransferase